MVIMMKGYIYTLEVVFAAAIVFAATVFIFNLLPPQQLGAAPIIKKSAYNALSYMDVSGSLRPLVLAGDEIQIEKALSALLPVNIGYETQICRESCGTFQVETNRTVVVVDYYVAGLRENYAGSKVRLWAWQKF